jgi:hypothetical protein
MAEFLAAPVTFADVKPREVVHLPAFPFSPLMVVDLDRRGRTVTVQPLGSSSPATYRMMAEEFDARRYLRPRPRARR